MDFIPLRQEDGHLTNLVRSLRLELWFGVQKIATSSVPKTSS
jgi:hypothetical protein